MPADIVSYITHHGYLAIFLLVFLQEIGVPNPVPNELVLLFSGYLAYMGVLSFPLVFLTVVAGDFTGTSILYFVFYFFGMELEKKSPKWLPVGKIDSFKEKISKRGKTEIYLGRLIPYARGYVSVAAGLIQIPPRVFLTTVLLSAITWSGGYAILGRLLGKEWNSVIVKLGLMRIVIILVIIFLMILGFKKIFRHIRKRKNHEI